jgi:hypothetical protein
VTRFDAAAQQALWICGQRKEALPTSSTTPTAAANGSGQMMCYQNRTSPSAIDTAAWILDPDRPHSAPSQSAHAHCEIVRIWQKGSGER